MANSSPNVRVKADTNKRFHQRQAQVAAELGVGLRGVTADIMVASLLRLADGDDGFARLVYAVQQERECRAKGRASGEVD